MQRQIDDLTDANDTLTRENGSLSRELSSLRSRRIPYRSTNTSMLSYIGASGDCLEAEDGESIGTEGKYSVG